MIGQALDNQPSQYNNAKCVCSVDEHGDTNHDCEDHYGPVQRRLFSTSDFDRTPTREIELQEEIADMTPDELYQVLEFARATKRGRRLAERRRMQENNNLE